MAPRLRSTLNTILFTIRAHLRSIHWTMHKRFVRTLIHAWVSYDVLSGSQTLLHIHFFVVVVERFCFLFWLFARVACATKNAHVVGFFCCCWRRRAGAKTTAIYIYKIGIYQVFYINSDVVTFIHSAKSEQKPFGRCVIKRPRLKNHIYAFPAAIILFMQKYSNIFWWIYSEAASLCTHLTCVCLCVCVCVCVVSCCLLSHFVIIRIWRW